MTPGVVRVGDTVRRPTGSHSPFVHALLQHLEEVSFHAVPRFLGIDESGREILSYIEGSVPGNINPGLDDEEIEAAAGLLRRYHDATAGSVLAGSEEVVCHNDISPVNTVFVDGRPAALIDFDAARPGPRMRDVSYGMFLWLHLGWDGPSAERQLGRIRLWCDAYGLTNRSRLIEEVQQRVRETAESLRRAGLEDATRWWYSQLDWVERHQDSLVP